jgi:hypothetical protein
MEKPAVSRVPLVRRRRKRWPRSVWAEEIKAFRESGLTPEGYAAKRGLRAVTLRKWARVLGDRQTTSKGANLPTFVPVNIVGSQQNQRSSQPLHVEVELACGRRVRARVGAAGDVKRLADLLDALDGEQRC